MIQLIVSRSLSEEIAQSTIYCKIYSTDILNWFYKGLHNQLHCRLEVKSIEKKQILMRKIILIQNQKLFSTFLSVR